MWPFKKKPAEGIAAIPEEIQDYYAAEKRGRTGVAWLLALATLLTTLALAAILFFGVRWAYRKIHHPSQTPAQVTSPETPANQPTGDSSNNSPTPKPSRPTSPPKKPTATRKPAPRVATVTPSRNLANTGPGNIVTLFAITTVVASLGHFVVVRYRG